MIKNLYLVIVISLLLFCSTLIADEKSRYDRKLGIAWFSGYPGYYQNSGSQYYGNYYSSPARIDLDYSSKNGANKYRTWEFGMSAGVRNDKHPTETYNVASSQNEDTFQHIEDDYVRVNFGVGTRKYIVSKKLSPFYQYSTKFSVGYSYTNSYYDFDTDKEEDESKSYSVSLGGGLMFGVEYFFTDQFSVALHYEVTGAYSKGLIRAPGDISRFYINDSSGLRFGWHW